MFDCTGVARIVSSMFWLDDAFCNPKNLNHEVFVNGINAYAIVEDKDIPSTIESSIVINEVEIDAANDLNTIDTK